MKWFKDWGRPEQNNTATANRPKRFSSQEKETANEANASKPEATVFIDYEHWYYSLLNLHGIKPNPATWLERVETRYRVKRILVFANFGDEQLATELHKIRQITNNCIETRNGTQRNRKDMSDFIMLDAIYQCVDSPEDADTYLLLTGDGHFLSVVKYLRQRKNKHVVVYGVANATSRALKSQADECIELPYEDDVLGTHLTMIFENLAHFERKRHANQYPTFMKTVEAVCNYYGAAEEDVQAALQWLLQKGYIDREVKRVDNNVEITAMNVHWERIRRDQLYE